MGAARGGRLIFSIALGAVVLVAVGLGVGLGVGLHNSHHTSDASKTTKNAGSNAVTTSQATVTPLPAWNWTSSTQKMYGMALGNWLVLERWMDEDWFTGLAGANAWDEWTFTQALGSNASTALTDHWNTWITQTDIQAIASAGYNTLRIPIGFWALIPTEGDEPYVSTGQLDQVNRILEYAYNSSLYVVLDLHGMPGSQNGEQESGHNTTDIEFYSPAQQTRADATIQAALAFITNSTYSSVFSGLAICNEPRTYTDDQLATLTQFYTRTYNTISAMSNPVPMIFHHAFQGIEYWTSFIDGKNPNILIMEAHPYPGNFPLQTDASDILNQVCTNAQGFQGYGVPVAVTEWSLTTGLTDSAFETQFYNAQASVWAWSGGSIFWSYKTIKATNPVLSNDSTIAQYSFVDMLSAGVITAPSAGESISDFLTGLSTECGSTPTENWPSPVVSVYASGSQAPVRRRRNFH